MISVEHISKVYIVERREAGLRTALRAFGRRERHEVHAITDMSFCIPDGQMVGMIGPNGAGKSTLVKLLSGILTPTEGSCLVNGRTPWKERKRHVKEIGVVFGQRSQLWWDVPVIDSYDLLRDIYDVALSDYRVRLEELTERLSLSDCLNAPVRQLSLGQRMRCEIAASLLHAPRTLFLDEPALGLDAVTKLNLRAFLRDYCPRQGTTLLLTTHDMQDIEALADRVLLIGKGRLLMDGTFDGVRAAEPDVQSLDDLAARLYQRYGLSEE